MNKMIGYGIALLGVSMLISSWVVADAIKWSACVQTFPHAVGETMTIMVYCSER